MPAEKNTLQCIVVTPERTVLDRAADFVAVTLYDGEAGFLPGRAPLISRLGYGELRTVAGGQTERFYIDGGFVQVQDNVVAVLTPQAIPAGEINVDAAKQQLGELMHRPPATGEDWRAHERAQAQYRGQLAVAGRGNR